ncbi:MAG: hypothetical protein ACJ76F_14620, partial [Bacteroidia bacterium]
MMNKILLFLFFFSLLNGHSQKMTYAFPETFPSFYNFHPEEAFEKLNAKPLPGMNEEQSTSFRMHTMYELQRSLDQNEVCLDWLLVEDYLYRVFDT